jgi:subtilisin family serine protease
MTRTMLSRVLLAGALVVATVIPDSSPHAQGCPLTNLSTNCPPGGGGNNSNNNNKVLWYVLGGVAVGVVGWIIGTRVFGQPERPDPFEGRTSPPDPQDGPPGSYTSTSAISTAPQATQAAVRAPVQIARNGFNLPPPGETRFLTDEVMLDIPSSIPTRLLDTIAARYGMTRLESKTFRLTGRTLHRWRIEKGGSVPDAIRTLSGDKQVAGAQPIYLYGLAQEALPAENSDQYAPDKMSLTEAHRLATGRQVLVAVIDSGIDTSHPDLAGAVVDTFDAAGDGSPPHPHGTGMAGAIAARRTVLSSAPRVGLLAIRAFSSKAGSAEGTTFNIIKGLDWAAEKGARVVNMSFAGPADPRVKEAIDRAAKKGMVLIAAAGNAGPRSPPLYPAADPNVIAVTATDIEDKIFAGANRGNYIAVAAPGVDILVPAPDGTYQFTTGTSVAAAEVSGVAALLIERNPSLKPADIRRILMRTAKDLGGKSRERDFGAGLVNAYQAVSAARANQALAAVKPKQGAAPATPQSR